MNITLIVAIALGAVRLIESILQWYNSQETKNALEAIWTILKNFFLDLETYTKPK